jgi:predicted MFS family arabinose efflux permease
VGAQVAAFAISASFFAVFFYVTIYLQAVRHMSPIAAGLVYLPACTLIFIVSGASAGLLERVSKRAMIAGGLALVAIGMAMCLVAGAGTSWVVLMPGLLVAAVETGLFNPALSALAPSEAPAHQSGLAAGVNDAFRNVGITVGVAALGALIPAWTELSGGDAGAYVTGFHHALLVCAGLAGSDRLVAGLDPAGRGGG